MLSENNHIVTVTVVFFILIGLTGLNYGLFAQTDSTTVMNLLTDFKYRNLSAFRAGAWIGDIAVPSDNNKYTFYVAARNGGVWKTINNGTTFFPIFDHYGVNAIGSVEVAPSNSDHVWVGTGEDSYARSSYSGNGIYKSQDAGKTFKCMGLKDSHHIGKIIIHPQNPDIVYAAVMGHLFSMNHQRGVFKTINGGKTWTKVLYIDRETGVVDLCINPQNPEELFAAAYYKVRLPWHYEAGGKKSRIHKTSNGGKTWKQLSGGLPEGCLGRIGIDIHKKNPNIVYAVIQNLNPKAKPTKTTDGFDPFTDTSYDDLIGGEVYCSKDGGEKWEKVSAEGVDVSGKAAYSFNEIYVDPQDPLKVYIIGVFMQYSFDGGKTWPKDWNHRELFLKNFGDVRTFWINPENPDHMMLGSDGGLYITYDGGKTTNHHYQIPLGEVYKVEVDQQDPYNIYVGLQDHEIWKGPVNGWSGSVGLEDWVIVGLWDGMYCSVNPQNNRWLYFTSQFGKHHCEDQLTGKRVEITPVAAKGEAPYRYTWTTPLVLSPHNPDILYTGGQMLLRSVNKGESWEEISPDLTENDPKKIAGKGHIMFCTITSISESPVKSGLIWVGTDDGRVQLTQNHGSKWKNLTKKIKSSKIYKKTWVSSVTASCHSSKRAYITKSGYRQDVFKPLVFVTDDMGESWTDIASNLPQFPVSVLIEDKINPDLLFAGTDNGVFFSLNRGKNWSPLKLNMPPVPVRDLKIQSLTQDLVVGTYGRGVYIINISVFQEVNADILDQEFYLFKIIPQSVNNSSPRSGWGNYQMTGDNHLRTRNERAGLKIHYYIKEKMEDPQPILVYDVMGKVINKIKIKNARGIHRVTWNSPDRKKGTYRFVFKNKELKVQKKGLLKGELLWPVGRIKKR